MSTKRFDATLKHLLERYPRDLPSFLLPLLGFPQMRRVEAVDAEVSTVSAAADKVFRVPGRRPWLLHLEVQSGHNRRLARQLLLYDVLLSRRRDCCAESLP